MKGVFLSVIIPAFNEEGNIAGTLEQVTAYLSGQPYTWEVVVADDGSSDDTSRLVEEFRNSHPGVELLKLRHGGKGWAVRQGMLKAKGEYRFLCDADLSMPIEQLERFLPPLAGEFDIAIGSREAPGARRFHEPYVRHLMGRFFNRAVQLVAVPGLEDTQCGFKCFRGEAAQGLFALQLTQGFAFDVEILFLAHKRGLRIVEVPIDWYYRRESRVRPLLDAILMLGSVFRIRWNQTAGRYPVKVPVLERSPAEGEKPK